MRVGAHNGTGWVSRNDEVQGAIDGADEELPQDWIPKALQCNPA